MQCSSFSLSLSDITEQMNFLYTGSLWGTLKNSIIMEGLRCGVQFKVSQVKYAPLAGSEACLLPLPDI